MLTSPALRNRLRAPLNVGQGLQKWNVFQKPNKKDQGAYRLAGTPPDQAVQLSGSSVIRQFSLQAMPEDYWVTPCSSERVRA
jgi:hypothetical protein